jgi:peptidoglycan hydrolase-like protein with peptidoglycan-binding domain
MLQSSLLSGDPRLQKCAIQHPAHVQLGDRGPHVKLIQIALAAVDNADIADGESRASLYGQTTAAAVLAFKTARNIINKSYQTKPDSIVGVMTIAALDAEMRALELKSSLINPFAARMFSANSNRI